MRPSDFPIQGDISSNVIVVSCPRGSAHVPDHHISGLRVMPYNVRFAVTVEVFDSYDLPAWRNALNRRPLEDVCCSDLQGAVHQPVTDVTSLRVLPDQVRMTILIEI